MPTPDELSDRTMRHGAIYCNPESLVLAKLCTICRGWLATARSLLYRWVRLATKDSLSAFLTAVTAKAELGSTARVLDIDEFKRGQYGDVHGPGLNVAELQRILPLLPNLQQLSIRTITFQAESAWESLFAECSSQLRALSLVGFHFESRMLPTLPSTLPGSLTHLHLSNIRMPVSANPICLPNLRYFGLEDYGVLGHVRWPNEVLQFTEVNSLYLRVDYFESIQDFLQRQGPFLRKIRTYVEYDQPLPSYLFATTQHVEELLLERVCNDLDLSQLPKSLQTLGFREIYVVPALISLVRALEDPSCLPNLRRISHVHIDWKSAWQWEVDTADYHEPENAIEGSLRSWNDNLEALLSSLQKNRGIRVPKVNRYAGSLL